MRIVWAISWRDIKSIVLSPFFVTLMALVTSLWSYSFVRNLIDFSYKSTSPIAMNAARPSVSEYVFMSHYSLTNMILIFLVPILTMRFYAGEKKDQTFSLLMTLPVSSTQVCIGKFLASLFVVSFILGLSFIYPLFTFFWIDSDLVILLSSYLGLFLLASCYASIGLFCSSFSSSLILSVAASVVINLSLWFLSQGVIFSDGDLFVSVLQYLSISDHLFSFIQGFLSLSSVVFFCSLIAFFVFLSHSFFASHRWR